ncbi:hypothetical protein SELMODRAFT_413682 [Selaginella moellendorffii]|uniref:Uncharacterized protein n=1 Tax=Selaginella moellendorffii TaxID=88036 RepID=D8RPW1_SELML|nr:hypothetical protein SELMODRAFT_413682 [Selaginella moellendorffii]
MARAKHAATAPKVAKSQRDKKNGWIEPKVTVSSEKALSSSLVNKDNEIVGKKKTDDFVLLSNPWSVLRTNIDMDSKKQASIAHEVIIKKDKQNSAAPPSKNGEPDHDNLKRKKKRSKISSNAALENKDESDARKIELEREEVVKKTPFKEERVVDQSSGLLIIVTLLVIAILLFMLMTMQLAVALRLIFAGMIWCLAYAVVAAIAAATVFH